jgi:cytochrome c oxidase subunit 4
MNAHIVPVRTYFAVFATLLVLTGVTTAVAFVDLRSASVAVTLAIAILKASLVVLYFMHMRHSPRLVPLAFVAALFWFLLLVVLTLSDYETRGWLGVPGK